jgi:ketosteroid isomerase-like protein
MKTLIFLVLIIGTICLTSCNRTSQTKVLTTQAADSLVKQWNNAWNEKNEDAVMKLIAADAFMVIDKKMITGNDSIRKLFVNSYIGLVRNLKIKKVTCKVEKKFTWYCGTFSHLVVHQDSLIGNEKGNIIFTWKPQPDNSWKLSFISIQ